ncbi:MAG: hypothetical protein N4A70_17950 [Pelagimonas sp.]|nr:hypothetical protein [Pelagimonas sp.]
MKQTAIILTALAAALYLALLWISFAHVMSETGSPVLDVRFYYSFEQAYDFIKTVEQQPGQTALGILLVELRLLDTFFPVILMLAGLAWTRVWETGPKRLYAALPLIAYAVSDLLENAQVGLLLSSGSEQITAQMVQRASTYTTAKWAFVVLSVLALIWLFRRRTPT